MTCFVSKFFCLSLEEIYRIMSCFILIFIKFFEVLLDSIFPKISDPQDSRFLDFWQNLRLWILNVILKVLLKQTEIHKDTLMDNGQILLQFPANPLLWSDLLELQLPLFEGWIKMINLCITINSWFLRKKMMNFEDFQRIIKNLTRIWLHQETKHLQRS